MTLSDWTQEQLNQAAVDWSKAARDDQARQAWLRENEPWRYTPEELANPMNMWGSDYDPSIKAARVGIPADYIPLAEKPAYPVAPPPVVEGAYKCPICGADFQTDAQLQIHVWAIHSTTEQKTPPDLSGGSTGRASGEGLLIVGGLTALYLAITKRKKKRK